MANARYQKEINRFLSDHIGAAIGDSDPIFEMGLVDSMFAVQIVHFIEVNYGIHIGPEDLEMTHFRTVEALAGLVARKRASLDGRAP